MPHTQDDEADTLDGFMTGAHDCPFVARNHPRCGSRFALARLEQAMSICFAGYHACPMFHRFSADCERLGQSAAAPSPLVAVTIHAHRTGQQLLPTGT